METALEEVVEEPKLAEMLDWWRRERHGKILPPVASVDPTRIPVSALPHVAVLDPPDADNRVRVRLTGSQLDLEIGIEPEALGIAILQAATEFLGQAFFGKIGDVRGHPRDREPRFWSVALIRVIIAVRPGRVSHNGLTTDLMKGDVLRGMARRGSYH